MFTGAYDSLLASSRSWGSQVVLDISRLVLGQGLLRSIEGSDHYDVRI